MRKRIGLLILLGIIVLAVSLTLAWLFWLRWVPLTKVFSVPEAPAEVSGIGVELDTGDQSRSWTIDAPDQIREICASLRSAQLCLDKTGVAMDFDATRGEYLLILYIAVPDSQPVRIYLKEDGTVYNGSSRYRSQGDIIPALYRSILETPT